MTDTVKELVDAMVKGSALDTEKAFGAAMAEKLSGKMDDMRTDIAKNMFATEEETDLAPAEEEAVEDDQVESEEQEDIKSGLETAEEATSNDEL